MFTLILMTLSIFFFFFFNDTATTEIYTLSLHDALPISDPFETSVTGLPDSIDNQGRVVVKRNPAPQPNHHWGDGRSEEHTSELQSQSNLVCRLLLEKKKKTKDNQPAYNATNTIDKLPRD